MNLCSWIIILSGISTFNCKDRFYRQRTFWETSVWARCQLNCYQTYRNESVVDHYEGDLRDISCSTSRPCSECLLPCNIYYSTLSDCLDLCVEPACIKSCEFIENVMFGNEKSSIVSHNFTTKWSQTQAKILCMDINDKNEELIVYLGWNALQDNTLKSFVFYIIEMTSKINNFQNNQTNSTSLDDWSTLGKSLSTSIKISSLNISKNYRFKITPVSVDGIISQSIVSQFTSQQTSLHKNFKVPRDFKIANFTYMTNESLKAILKWSNSMDHSCYYSFYWHSTSNTAKAIDYFSLRVDKPKQRIITLRNLSYGWSYAVDARSNDRNWIGESLPARLNFKTPSCLELTNYNFSKCAPIIKKIDFLFFANESYNEVKKKEVETFKNLSVLTKINGSSSVTIGSGPIIVFISWTIPGLTDTNAIVNITLKLAPIHFLSKILEFSIPGNIRYIYVNGLQQDSTYKFVLSPLSLGGTSNFVKTFHTTKISYESANQMGTIRNNQIKIHKDLSKAILIMTGIFLVMLAVAIALYLARRYKLLDDKFFGKINNKEKGISLRNYSEGPIPKELIRNYWYDLDQKFKLNSGQLTIPHFTWGRIEVIEEIGHGAFGKVLKAKIVTENVAIEHKECQETLSERKPGFVEIFNDDNFKPAAVHRMEKTGTVALKVLKDLHSEDEIRDLLEEIWLMSLAGKHPNIVNLLGYSGDSKLAAVMEYCTHGCLHSYLRNIYRENNNYVIDMKVLKSLEATEPRKTENYENCPLTLERLSESSLDSGLSIGENNHADIQSKSIISENVKNSIEGIPLKPPNLKSDLDLKAEDILSFARQIAAGMDFLACKKLIHRDLAARNILVCENKVVKIADFGLARDIYAKSAYFKKSNGKVPIKWMSPESMVNNSYTTKSDVWSYGVLLWEMITLGAAPYPGIPHIKLAELLLYGYRMSQPKNCDNATYQIMLDCWNLDPKKRPSFKELREIFEKFLLINSDQIYFS